MTHSFGQDLGHFEFTPLVHPGVKFDKNTADVLVPRTLFTQSACVLAFSVFGGGGGVWQEGALRGDDQENEAREEETGANSGGV